MDGMNSDFSKSRKKHALKQSDEEHILEYLIANPQFFIRYPEALDKIELPHPVKGTISLLEAQQKRLKDMVKMLTDEMNHWSENASCNEGIFRTFLSLYTDLYQCKSVHEMVKLLNDSCRDYLFVPYARIWLNEERIDDLMKCDERYLLSLDDFSIVCENFMQNELCNLGKIQELERKILFENSDLIYSRVLIRLGESGDLGVLVFGHADASHYHKGLECSFIQHLASYISLLLPRFVKLK